MAVSGSSGGWSGFAKTVLIPLFIALALYISIFHAVLPLYRRYQTHIARYASYTPLTSGFATQTTSLFNPIIEPSRSLWTRTKRGVRLMLWRWAVPGVQHVDLEHRPARGGVGDEDGEEMRNEQHLDLDDDDDDGLVFSGDEDEGNQSTARAVTHGRNESEDDAVLFDDYTAGNMVSFDVRSSSGDGRRFGLGRRRAESRGQTQIYLGSSTRQLWGTHRQGMERRRIGGDVGLADERHATAPDAQMNSTLDVDDSNRRLSRELEEGFKDDSSHSEDEFEQGVTVGRKSLGRR